MTDKPTISKSPKSSDKPAEAVSVTPQQGAGATANDSGQVNEFSPKLPNMGTQHKAITGKDRETKAIDRSKQK